MKTSEQISVFLELIRDAPTEHGTAWEQVSDADKKVQDILHWLENNEILPVDGDGAMLILGVMGMTQRDRRAARDAAAIMQPVAEWAKTHKSTLDSLAQLLGAVRKAEKHTGDRPYTDRTDIMRVMLGGPDEEDEG